MTHVRPTLISLLLCSCLVACQDADLLTAPSGNTGERPTIKTNPAFAADIMEIFVRRDCTVGFCHAIGEGGLTLTDDPTTSYGNLVGVSASIQDEVLVIPNNAADSYLIKKLEETPGMVGELMPLNRTRLNGTDLENIKNLDQHWSGQ